MSNLTTRAGKGSPLTNNELDANFTNLNADKVEIGGDLSGTSTAPNVAKIQGRAVSADTPENGEKLVWNGTAWEPATDPSGEPIGHEDKSQSSISFNTGTRTFTIAPVSANFVVWCKGVKHTYTTAQTVVIPNTTGLHFIYFNASGVLSTQMTYFTWEEHAPTAYIYWNATTQQAVYFGDERHGITLDWQTHEYLHRTRGAAIASGFGASGYTTTGAGSTDADAQIDIGGGTFFDEDLQVDIVSTNTPVAGTWQQDLSGPARIPVLYLSGSAWVIDAPTDFPFKVVSGVPQYNLLSGSTWSTAPVTNNEYFVTWILATHNLTYPVISVIGQAQTNNISAAESMTFEGLTLPGFPSVEFRPLYKIIYQYKTSYANTVKVSTVAVYDLRSISAAGVAAALVQDHGNLSGLGDDDHAQYLHVSSVRSPSAAVTNSFLPSQASQSGKYLTTDGSNPSWGAIPSGSLTFTGDVTGTGNTGSSTTLTLANSGVTAGIFTKVTVDAKGRVTTGASASSSDITTALGFTPENVSNKAVANGYASLDSSGKVPSNQLPSYVDDVLEYANLAAFPGTGETGKIYVAISTNKVYRWSGSAYVEITSSPGSTDAVPEGSTNLYFTNARARAAVSASGSLSYSTSTGIFSYTQPTNVSAFTNDSGYLTGITGAQVTTALGYTPPQPNGTGATGTWGISISGNAATASTWQTARTESLTGDVTGSASVNGSANWSITTTLANSGVTAGTYTKVTVDAKGRVTTGASLASGDLPTYTGTLTSGQVTTALGYTPLSNATSYLPLSGGTLTGASTVSVSSWAKWTLETTGVTAKARQGSDGNGLNFTSNAQWTGSAWAEDDTAKKKFAYIQHLGNGRHEFRTSPTGAGISWTTSLTIDESGVNSSVALTQAGNQVLHAGNYNSYSPSLTGSGASGTWGISITGSAGSASNSTTVGGLAPAQFFNNMGNNHNTYTDFNNVPGFGAYYVQQGGNSPTGTANHQWYGITLGLGNEYAYSSYASQLYWPRRAQNGETYLYVRDRESGSWNGWTKIRAGYADSAGSADQIDGVAFRNTGSNSPTAADSLASNGITYVASNISLFGQTDGALYSQVYNGDWQHQIFGDYRTGQIALRGKNLGTWQSWRTVLDSSNYTSYSLPLSGGTLTGAIRAPQITAGGSTNTDANLGVQGSAHITGTIYYGGTVGNINSWSSISTSSSGTHTFSGSRFIFDRYGYGSQPLIDMQSSSITLSQPTYATNGITVNDAAANGRGINLYSGSPTSPTYGLFFAQTGNFGTYGAVSADWATYFTMNSTAHRGWIFREHDSLGNVAAISNQGNMTLRSHFEQGNNIARPNVSWSASSTSTGMVIFYLPGTTSNYGMVHMVFDIYEYNSNAVSTVIVGGHNWSTSWYNISANVIGQCGKEVRLGCKDGRFCVVFGTSGSVWEYGTIVLRKIHNGSFYDNIMNMVGDWSATQTATESFTNITGDLRALRTPASFNAGGAITQAGNQVLHAGNYSSYAVALSGDQSIAGTKTFTTQIRTNRVEGTDGAFLFRIGIQSGTTRHLNLSDSTTDPASATTSIVGITWGSRDDTNPYYLIYPHYYSNGYSTHNRLRLAWHTGIEIGAASGYGGTRFFNNSPFAGSEIFSVGKGDDNVRVANSLYVQGDSRGQDVYTTGGWFRNHTNNNGIYWSQSGWHLYPADAGSFYVRSGTSAGSLLFLNSGGSGLGYVHAAADAAMGFLTTGGSWRFRVDNSGNARCYNNLYLDQNYGHGIVGVYASTRYQGVFAMGDSYKLPADGTGPGNLYGLAWSYPSAGGVAGNLDSHGLLVLINGGLGSAISYSIVAAGNVTAYSDERLKTNWREMPENYVERLAQVKVGIYDRIDGEKITQVGIGAQSFQRLLPEAITKAADEMGTLSVSYGNAAMASAVELAKELVMLKKELAEIKSRLH